MPVLKVGGLTALRHLPWAKVNPAKWSQGQLKQTVAWRVPGDLSEEMFSHGWGNVTSGWSLQHGPPVDTVWLLSKGLLTLILQPPPPQHLTLGNEGWVSWGETWSSSVPSAGHSLYLILVLGKYSSLFGLNNKHFLSTQYVQDSVLVFWGAFFFLRFPSGLVSEPKF